MTCNDGEACSESLLGRLRGVVSATVAFVVIAAQPVAAVTLDLVPVTPTQNTFTLDLAVGGLTDTDVSTANGSIDVDLQHTLVGSDAVVIGIEFTGGQVNFDDISFVYTILVIPFLTIEGENVAGEPDTPNPPSAVTNGQFDASEHGILVNQGTFVSSGLANETIFLDQDPFGGPGSPTDPGTVTTTEVARTPSTVTYDTTVRLPLFFMDLVQDMSMGDPITAELTLNGALEARGEWTVSLGPIGDFNGDLKTDAGDYVILRDTLGATGPGLPADANGDEVVDEIDFNFWAADFGAMAPPLVSGVVAVPEPAGVAMLLLGSLGAAGSVRRSGRDR